LDVYKLSAGFPRDELYGLTSQLRRSCVSIAANLAEGCGRGGDADFARFCQMAMGSASEVQYHLLLARDLGFIKPERHDRLAEAVTEIKRMLASLLKTLRGTKEAAAGG